MSSRTTSSSWVKGVVELLDDAGLDAAALLAEAGLERPLIEDPDGRVPTEKVSALWLAAVAASNDPAIALVGSRLPKPGNFDVVGFAMLSSRNLHTSLQAFSEHMRLVSDAAQIELADHEGVIYVRFHVYGGREPIPRQRMEFDLLAILTFCRWVAGRPVKPLATMLTWPRSEYADRLDPAFGCNVCYDSEFNGYIFSAAELDAPLPAANATLAQVHDNVVRRRLAIFDGTSLSVKVRDQIARALGSGEPRRETIAAALNLSDRTLRRRLEQEGLSFEKLLDLTRCDMAQYYLAHPRLTLAQITHMLGFVDQSAFFRASRRWFGCSPGKFREQMRYNLQQNDDKTPESGV